MTRGWAAGPIGSSGFSPGAQEESLRDSKWMRTEFHRKARLLQLPRSVGWGGSGGRGQAWGAGGEAGACRGRSGGSREFQR